MKLIDPNVVRISNPNPYKLVELIGRTCYKSEDKITEDSYISFVRGLVKRQHYAMLEHGRIAFVFTFKTHASTNIDNIIANMYSEFQELPKCYLYVSKYLNEYGEYEIEILIICSLSHLYNTRWRVDDYKIRVPMLEAMKSNAEYTYKLADEELYQFDLEYVFSMTSSCNIRVITDSSDIENVASKFDVDELYYKLHVTTLKFICDRAVSHELVRHRVALAQESQRYCGYDKDKFGGEIVFVKPANFNDSMYWSSRKQRAFKESCATSERLYLLLRKLGAKPEIARTVLTNAVKTEVVMTGTQEEWQHFLNMRYREITGKVHPDMKTVADLAAKFLED